MKWLNCADEKKKPCSAQWSNWNERRRKKEQKQQQKHESQKLTKPFVPCTRSTIGIRFIYAWRWHNSQFQFIWGYDKFISDQWAAIFWYVLLMLLLPLTEVFVAFKWIYIWKWKGVWMWVCVCVWVKKRDNGCCPQLTYSIYKQQSMHNMCQHMPKEWKNKTRNNEH